MSDSEHKIDPRLEKMIPKSDDEKQSSSSPAPPTKKDYQPWELDNRGRPLGTAPKEETEYEKWLEERRKDEGVQVECPKCGIRCTVVAFVSGQKCWSCGAILEEDEQILKKMSERDEEHGIVAKMGVGHHYHFPNIELAIPGILLENEDQPFSHVFRQGAAIQHVTYLIVYLVLFVPVMAFIMRNGIEWYDYLLLTLVVIIGITICWGLALASKVTSIRVDENGAEFHGWSTSQWFNWKEIKSIENVRELNSHAITVDSALSIQRIWHWLMTPVRILTYYFYAIFHIYKSPEQLDTSSTSSLYTNHISISTGSGSVSYSFVGNRNVGFIQALAIIIFMARKQNPRVWVDKDAYKAAEKGSEHHADWEMSHGW